MLLDTSIVIEIFRSGEDTSSFQEIYASIENEPLFMSIIQFGEISDWCLRNGIDPQERISSLKLIVNVIPLTENLCLEGSKIKHAFRTEGISGFSLIDGIILASARFMGQKVLTKDTDFRKADDVLIVG